MAAGVRSVWRFAHGAVAQAPPYCALGTRFTIPHIGMASEPPRTFYGPPFGHLLALSGA